MAVIDDDQEAIDYLVRYITLTDDFELVFTTTNPKDGLSYLKRLEVHVLFLDIEMPLMDGLAFLPQLQAIKLINKRIAQIEVIVCSAYDRFAINTYDYKVADYLLKPVVLDRYMQAVNEVKQRLQAVGLNALSADNRCLLVGYPGGTALDRSNYSDIIYVEAKDDKTWLWAGQEEYFEVNVGFSNMLMRLPKSNFVQVHRSFAVSLRHVKGLRDNKILLLGTDREISRGKKGGYPHFERWLDDNAVSGRKRVFPTARSVKNGAG